MYAIRQHEFGGPDRLLWESVDDPVAEPGRAVVEVAAAGVHLLDTSIRRGEAGPMGVANLPMTPGREVAGTVVEVGADVDEAWLGRRVVAHLGMTSGGYAQRASVLATSLHDLPDGLDPSAAVAMIGTGRTAMGILEVAAMTADDVVLVPAAAGGLGNLFVQHARNLGATVVGMAGGAGKVAMVESLGADVVVDSNAPSWPDHVRSWLGDREPTLLLDGVGGDTGRAALDLLGVAGRVVVFGWSAGEPTEITTADLMGRGLTATAIGPRLLRRPGGLRDLEAAALAEAAARRWVPLVDEYPLKEASWAHAALEGRATTGKVVLLA